MNIISKATYIRGKNATNNAIDKIVKSQPHGIVMVGTSGALANFVSRAKKAGLVNSEFCTVSFVGSETFAKDLKKYGKNTSKNVLVSQVVPSPYATKSKSVDNYIFLFNKFFSGKKPNYVSYEGFINAQILVEAIKRCGKIVNREKIRYILKNMSKLQLGINMKSKINAFNHSFFTKVYLSKIKDGKFVTFQE